MKLGEAFDMHLVDDRVIPRHELPAGLAAPVEAGIDHDAFGHEGRAVTLVEGSVVARLHLVAEHRGIPCQGAGLRPRIGIEQQLVRIEAMAVLGRVRPVHAIAIEAARPDPRQVTVKYLVGIFRQLDAVGFGPRRGIEQANLDLCRMGREHREIGPRTVPACAERMRKAFLEAR